MKQSVYYFIEHFMNSTLEGSQKCTTYSRSFGDLLTLDWEYRKDKFLGIFRDNEDCIPTSELLAIVGAD